MFPHPSLYVALISSCQSPLQWGSKRCHAKRPCGGDRAVPVAVPAAHHRSRPLLSPRKTQRVPSSLSRLNARPWNVKASTRCGLIVVLALEPLRGNVAPSPLALWDPGPVPRPKATGSGAVSA